MGVLRWKVLPSGG